MKQLITILTLLIFVSCGQQSDKKSLKEQTNLQNGKEQISEKKNISDLDSIVTDNYVISFQDAKSFTTTDIYGDLKHRIDITDSIGNSHDRAKKFKTIYNLNFPTTLQQLIQQ